MTTTLSSQKHFTTINNESGKLIFHKNKNYIPSKKILALDLDWTLIKPKSKSKFPKNIDDWEYLFGEDKIFSKLEEYNSKGFNIVIFTNQKNIDKLEKGRLNYKQNEFESRWLSMISVEPLSSMKISILVSMHDDFFRKPAISMWEYFVNEINHGMKIEECIYVGDAAGRKGDHSFTDIAFTYNINKLFYVKSVIDFKTPEEFFLGDKTKSNSGKELIKKMENNVFIPENYFKNLNMSSREKNNKLQLVKLYDIMKKVHDEGGNMLIVLVGAMASGKSTFYRKNLLNVIRDAGEDYEKSWHYMSMDTYEGGTIAKFKKDVKKYLVNGESVIIDNTNPKVETRKEYVDMAKNAGVDNIIAIEFESERVVVEHLNDIRNKYLDVQENLNDKGKITKNKVPGVAIATFFKNYKKVGNDEGFSEILKMDFVPEFENDDEKKKFMMILE